MILTAIVRNSRLTHIEERLSKLQSICQTAGLLPSEEQADTADDIFSPQGHQKSNGIDGNGKTQLHSVQAPPGPQFHDTEQGRTVPTPSTAEPDRPESGATETRDTAMSHDGKSGHLRGPESECFQDQTCPVVDATSHRASSSGQLAFLDDGVTSPHYPDQRPSTASCAIAVSSEMQTRASQSNVHAAPESDSMHATTLHDTTFHFETLAMVFADRSETKLLDELYSMVPSLTPVPLPTQDAMYAAMTNFFRASISSSLCSTRRRHSIWLSFSTVRCHSSTQTWQHISTLWLLFPTHVPRQQGRHHAPLRTSSRRLGSILVMPQRTYRSSWLLSRVCCRSRRSWAWYVRSRAILQC